MARFKISVVALLGAALAAPGAQAQAARYLCNGYDASGNISDDICGYGVSSCNANTAPRWEPASVAFRFDRSGGVPSSGAGVGTTQWGSDISTSIANWESAGAGGLQISDGGSATQRCFACDNSVNEIFWISSSSDWNSQVGMDAFSGVLGVTVSQHGCDGSPNRGAIYDADLAMNGVSGAVDWTSTSSIGVLAHEMGHALGLDHPCDYCTGAIMSAMDNGLETPQPSDIQGIQALYDIPPGAIGSPCSGDGDCDNNVCLVMSSGNYCSQTCSGSCTGGMLCTNVAGEAGTVCVFPGSGVAGVGDACGPPACVDECSGIDIGPGCNVCMDTCFAGCTVSSGAGCGANEGCFELQDQQGNGLGVGVCVPAGDVGRNGTCDPDGTTANVQCQMDLYCFPDGTSGRCVGTCTVSTGAGCGAGEQCIEAFTDGTGACFPFGTGVTDSTCDSFFDCAEGYVCLSSGRCAERCDSEYTCDDPTDTCVALTGGGGICRAGSEGEGEGEGEGEEPPPDGQCRISRGNFDCPSGEGCVVEGDDAIGLCDRGEQGDVGTFGLCEEDEECDSGLCERGVCSRPCDANDDGCPDGFECDEEAAPAGEPGGDPGICVPESCQDNRELCDKDAGFFCTYSPTGNYVCAKEGKPLCGCSSSRGAEASPLAGMVALVGSLGLALRRRQRR